MGGSFLKKLDGTRCFGMGASLAGSVRKTRPVSVIDPKTGQRKAKIKPIATGLWSRYGNPIIAPDAFLNLCLVFRSTANAGGCGNFQLCRSICGGDTPDPRFMDKIKYAIYSGDALGTCGR